MTAHVDFAASLAERRSAARLPVGQRVYAVGDVHGRLDLLEELIAAIRADNAARHPAKVKIILLGDIVDRGPDSPAIVASCMDFTERSPNFIVLKGNHESMMVDAYRGNRMAMRLWQHNGGAATLRSWGVPAVIVEEGDPARLLAAMRRQVPRRAIGWMDGLPLNYQAGGYFFVHAGVRPGIALEEQRTEDMLWIRDEFTDDRTGHPMVIVHGHSEHDAGPEMLSNRIGLDTGAYRTDVLTAVGFERGSMWTLKTLGTGAHGDRETV